MLEDFVVQYGIDDEGNAKSLRIKGDGEKSFMPIVRDFQRRYEHDKYHLYFRPPSAMDGFRFTSSYSLMDSVVRTIRDLIVRAS